MYINILVGIVFVALGLFLLLPNRQHAHESAVFYDKAFHVPIGKRLLRWCFIVGGLIFILIGLLTVLQIIDFR